MQSKSFAPTFESLPETLAVFPLGGVLLLPHGRLPLNIFEPRYLAMVEDALASSRMIGMIQPKNTKEPPDLYRTGCAGRITEFSETDDGRYLITLTGVCRFNIVEEISGNRAYRRVKPDWSSYQKDMEVPKCSGINRDKLYALLKEYFCQQDITCEHWEKIEHAPDGKLITCLAMICPFDAGEKQALLEAACGQTRAEMFMTMLEMAVHAHQRACSRH